MKKSLMPRAQILIIIFSILLCNLSNGQNINNAKELYNNKMYQNALTELNSIIKKAQSKGEKGKKVEEAEAYKALCTIALEQKNAESVANSFIKKYPSSSFVPKVRLRLAGYLFDKEEFTKSLKIYNLLNDKLLNDADRDEFRFKKAYSLFYTGKVDDADKLFESIISDKKSSTSNISAAKYYRAYIKYMNKDFEEAIPLFQECAKDVRFQQMSKYYILDSKFMLKDYNYVIKNGPAMMEKENPANKKIARLLAEAFYAKNNISEAKRYFDIYAAENEDKDDKDCFFGGMLSYSEKDYKTASEYLERFLNQEDSIAQNANYHLGECYINLKNKGGAMQAFKTASELDFDKQIKEDALFNYAKLSFELSGQISALEEYLTEYPVNREKKDEIYRYMLADAITQKDYDLALDIWNRIDKKSDNDRLNYCKANLFKGIEMLSNNSYSVAKSYLEKANSSSNRAINNLANLYLAEALFGIGNYRESLAINERLQNNSEFKESKEYPYSFFNSGYCHFKLKELDKAEEDFDNYITLSLSAQNNDNILAEEAKLRIADCRFMKRDYSMATKMYKKIASSQTVPDWEKDLHPYLQQAIAQGLMGNTSDKIATLKRITQTDFNHNKRYTEALYELGVTQLQNKDERGANETFIKLIHNAPDSLYYGKALLELGIINTNRANYERAIEYYEKAVMELHNTQEAEAALSAMENVYQEMGKPEEFMKFIQANKIRLDKTPQEEESILFNAIQQVYMSEKYEEAIKGLKDYLENYPDGNNYNKALYYTANSYIKLKENREAAKYLEDLIDRGYSPYYEVAALSLADIEYKNEEYDKAVERYNQLEINSKSTENKNAARLGQTRCYYRLREYDLAISKANSLYANSNSQTVKEEALYYKGKSLIAQGERDDANSVLSRVAENPNSEFGAEANYLIIKKLYDDAKFEEVEKQVFNFSDTKTSQQYWLAKSFIVLGDSYVERGSIKQANATYSSIRDNYTGGGDIIEIVNSRLSKLSNKK